MKKDIKKEEVQSKSVSRREFLMRSAALGAAGVVASSVIGSLTSCSDESATSNGKYTPLAGELARIPDMGEKAIDGKPIRAAMIGCGNRGSGAMMNFFEAADGVSIVALADIFEDRMSNAREIIEKRQGEKIEDKNIFIGFDAYQKVCQLPEVDMVIIATPSIFHSLQTKYAIEQGTHVFCEKPAGIDPVSCRTMTAAIMMARTKNLSIQTGCQRHHTPAYIESYKKVREGYIGEIRSAVLKWNQGPMFAAKRKPEWTDMEYMLRDFFSWSWLCGDHVIDQLIHQLDVFQWFSHLKPVSVVGMGSQLQRSTGDIFDNFALDITYEGGVRVNAQARQITGCSNDIGETIVGTLGTWTSSDMTIRDLKGEVVWKYEAGHSRAALAAGVVLEHVDMINSIRSNKPITDEAETLVTSSLVGAMSRESAYTGKTIEFEKYKMSSQSLMPKELHLGNIPDFEKKYVAPKMGAKTELFERGQKATSTKA